ncbi:MAG: hypothetical protein ACRD4S_01090 [Candidatus Acidiferrales bacterium]
MVSLRAIWRKATTTRYARALEDEVAQLHGEIERQLGEIVRLRAENRALLNSILGIAGVPPIVVAEEFIPSTSDAAGVGALLAAPSQPSAAKRARPLLRQGKHAVPLRTASAANGFANSPGSTPGLGARASGMSGPMPLRRRSWQQINRMLEFESARKKQPQD